MSHLILDLLTHGHDIVLWPGLSVTEAGFGLIRVPRRSLLSSSSFAYGIFCWRVYKGSRGLLALIVIGNLANLSFLSPAIPGPESFLAGRPLVLVTVVFIQIVVTLVLVGVLARRVDFKPSATLHLSRRISTGRTA